MARAMARRLTTFAKKAYYIAGFTLEVRKCSTMWLQVEPPAQPITDEDIARIKCQYQCAGCGRPEVNVLTRACHQRKCPYIQLVQQWTNPDDEDGEWEVRRLVAVRGPPERRFWQIDWATPDEAHEYSMDQQVVDEMDGYWILDTGYWKVG